MSRVQFLSVLLAITTIGSGVYYYYFVYLALPCRSPITYRFGSVDPRFGVSADEFTSDIEKAVAIWEQPTGTDLFVYDPAGTLPISLVYDRRQALTQQEQTLSATISQTSQVADSVRRTYESLRAQYDEAQRTYAADIARFKSDQATYNEKVAYWNRQGGAPKTEYDALNEAKDALIAEQNSLEAERQQVNELADTVNAYIHKYNLLVDTINTNVNAINTDGLAGTQFEEGVYIADKDGRRIMIYQFEDKTDLVRVLAHELGHSLGLGHNSNPDSIMNPVNQSPSLKASPDDLAALKTLCGSALH